MSDTRHLSNKKETNTIQTGYKLLLTLALALLCLFIIGLFHYISSSDSQNQLSELQTISQTLTLTQSQGAVPWLGLEVTDVTLEVAIKAGLDKVQGALIQSITFGSPACKAGMQPGDIIMSLNGRRIRSAKELKNDISGLDAGSEITMCITREDYRTTITAVLEPAPDWFPRENKMLPWLGVEIGEVVSEKDEKNLEDLGKEGGVLVKKVFPDSPASRAGIEPGDVIMSFNYRKMRTVREFLTDLCGAEPGDRIRICFIREDIRKTVYPVLEIKPPTSPEAFVSENYAHDQTNDKWGLHVSPLTESLRDRYYIPLEINGVIILQVEEGGMAEKNGFLPGDLITAINQKSIDDIQTFIQAFSNIEQGVLVETYRNQNFKYLSIGSSNLGIPKAL